MIEQLSLYDYVHRKSKITDKKLAFIDGLPQWLSSKEFTCKAGATGDAGSIPGSGRSPRGGNGNPPQYPCLENPMDRGAWKTTVHRVTKSWTQLKQLCTYDFSSVVKYIVKIFKVNYTSNTKES